MENKNFPKTIKVLDQHLQDGGDTPDNCVLAHALAHHKYLYPYILFEQIEYQEYDLEPETVKPTTWRLYATIRAIDFPETPIYWQNPHTNKLHIFYDPAKPIKPFDIIETENYFDLATEYPDKNIKKTSYLVSRKHHKTIIKPSLKEKHEHI